MAKTWTGLVALLHPETDRTGGSDDFGRNFENRCGCGYFSLIPQSVNASFFRPGAAPQQNDPFASSSPVNNYSSAPSSQSEIRVLGDIQQWYRGLVLGSSGVFYEDDNLQVGLSIASHTLRLWQTIPSFIWHPHSQCFSLSCTQ